MLVNLPINPSLEYNFQFIKIYCNIIYVGAPLKNFEIWALYLNIINIINIINIGCLDKYYIYQEKIWQIEYIIIQRHKKITFCVQAGHFGTKDSQLSVSH